MIKNGKYFVPPPKDDLSIKELFKRLATVGAGRPVDREGFSLGQWTPEILAEAISQIDANRNGIDLRTVQLWFQDNEKGISPENIRWLSRIFGCDDPDAARDWQVKLSEAQLVLTAKRRARRIKVKDQPKREHLNSMESDAVANTPNFQSVPTISTPEESSARRFSLAHRMDALFSQRSPLEIPVMVFAGDVTLGFLAYMLDMHDVVVSQGDASSKQVGFIWAPNWTALFLIFMPLYFYFVTDLLVFWKQEGRLALVTAAGQNTSAKAWSRTLLTFSYSYWAIFLICLPIVFLFQWVDLCLIPLITGDPGNFAMDWGRIAIVRPEVVSVPAAIMFTGVSYLYMGVCVFLFFVGLLLIYILVHDLWDIVTSSENWQIVGYQKSARKVGLRFASGIYRCTVLGLLITICLKLQSAFLQSSGETIFEWLIGDVLTILGAREDPIDEYNYNIPTHFSSLVALLAICAVFVYAAVRINAVVVRSYAQIGDDSTDQPSLEEEVSSQVQVPWWRMTIVIALLVVNYLILGVVVGFSLVLCAGVLLAIYSLFDPRLDNGR